MTRYLLDTHTLLWITTDDPKLSERIKNIYLNAENEMFFSLASIWELAIKSSLGKITFKKNLDDFIQEHVRGNNIDILRIEMPHVFRIENLPYHHYDPFDRLLIAQSIENSLTILSADNIFDKYNVTRVW